MFKVEISNEYDEIVQTYSLDTLQKALDSVKEQVLEGVSVEHITLTQEIPLSFTIDVQVKA